MLKDEFPEFNKEFEMLFVAEKWRKISWEVRLEIRETRSKKYTCQGGVVWPYGGCMLMLIVG